MSAGAWHSCAALANGTVRCWGDDTWEQSTPPADLKVGRPLVDRAAETICAVRVSSVGVCFNDPTNAIVTGYPSALGTVLKITTGSNHACAIKTDSTLSCWGSNASGQTTVSGGLGTVVDVGAGASHTCVIKLNSTLACWGSNTSGQATAPTGTFQSLAVGDNTNCALKTDNTVTCWGSNTSGQTTVPSLSSVITLSVGGDHACALIANSTTDCWGALSSPLTTTIAIASGAGHVCVVSAASAVQCGGSNANGQTTVPVGLKAVSLDGGSSGSCAVTFDGTLRCFHQLAFGQAAEALTMASATTRSAPATQPFTHTFAANLSPVPIKRAELVSGTVPPGLTLDQVAGTLSGTPTTEGIFTFTVRATDELFGSGANQTFSLTVTEAPVPGAPTLTGTDPASPGSTTTPRVQGAAETGSTVRIYTTSDCSGAPVGTGSATELATTGITVTAASGRTTEFRATATATNGNSSPCGAPISYTHVTPPADPPTSTSPLTLAPPFSLETACAAQRLTVLSARRVGSSIAVIGLAPVTATGKVTIRAGRTKTVASVTASHTFSATLRAAKAKSVTVTLGGKTTRATVNDLAIRGTKVTMPRSMRGKTTTVTVTAQTNCGTTVTLVPNAKATGSALSAPFAKPATGQTVYTVTVKGPKGKTARAAVLVTA